MPDEKSKTVHLDSKSIEKLPNNKPVVYEIFNKNGDNIYMGSVKRYNIQKRVADHLPGGQDPVPGGVEVKIQQKKSISEAEQSETRIITRSKPKYNIKGKPSK